MFSSSLNILAGLFNLHLSHYITEIQNSKPLTFLSSAAIPARDFCLLESKPSPDIKQPSAYQTDNTWYAEGFVT